MDSEQKNLENGFDNTMKNSATIPPVGNIDNQKDEIGRSIVQSQPEIDNITVVNDVHLNKQRMKKSKLSAIIFGGICTIAAIVFILLTPLADTSESAKSALNNKTSTEISAGTILLDDDESVDAKDYVIKHNSEIKETKIWIWDYAAEDGDYVQVLVNGKPTSDIFMIKNKPKVLIVPATGKVEVKGIKDGGGGITYAIRYEVNGTSYFNGAPEGEFNTYTLKIE